MNMLDITKRRGVIYKGNRYLWVKKISDEIVIIKPFKNNSKEFEVELSGVDEIYYLDDVSNVKKDAFSGGWI